MADKKISELTNIIGTDVSATDEFVVVDASAVETKAITMTELRSAVGNANFTVTGNITVTGTVDGRDIATDGTKLDGIEAGATGDQTASEILTALLTVDGASSTLDADLLDGQEGSYYTGYTDTAIANLIDTAPSTLDTLNELAAALGDDANFSTTVTNSIATKLALAGGTMTGDITFAGTQLFDGRDVSADGSKLDGIEVGATADQTAQEIATAIDADATAEATLKSALGLGTAAYTASTDYATAAQGSNADTAVQPNDSPTFGNVTATTYFGDGSNLTGIPAGYTNSDVDAHLNTGAAASGEFLSWNGADYDWASVPAGYANSDVDAHLNTSTATSDQILSWTGSDYAWVDQSSAETSLLNYNYTATSGQTTFSGADDNAATLSYTQQNLIVTLNGIVLEDGTDYTASNGTSIVLASGAATGDELNIVAFKPFTTADMVPASTGGTFSGNITATKFLTTANKIETSIFRVNAQSLTADTTIDADENASATGPLTVASGVTLTVTTGGSLAII